MCHNTATAHTGKGKRDRENVFVYIEKVHFIIFNLLLRETKEHEIYSKRFFKRVTNYVI